MLEIKLPDGLIYAVTPQEKQFIEKRLAEMSAKEQILLAAAMRLEPPKTAADLINLTFRLCEYELCYVSGDDRQLGEFVAMYMENIQPEAMDYIDREKLGRLYRERTPGIFCQGAYVIPPKHAMVPVYDGADPSQLKDEGWSVKLKLTSAQNKEGVWLRLPDYSYVNDNMPDEIDIALDALGADSLSDCKALEAVCALPAITNLLDQCDSLDQLVWDGSDLGYALHEAGQGAKNWTERFMAALEYEHCDRVVFALDISQNLHCYDYFPETKSLAEYGRMMAHTNKIIQPDSLLAEAFYYESYGRDHVEDGGLRLTENGYIRSNGELFLYEHSQPPVPETSKSSHSGMRKEEFIEKLHQLLSAPDDKTTESWIDWTDDLAPDTESYLQDLYTAFLGVDEKFGGELAQLIYTNIPNIALMYPSEFMLAAEHLHNGGSLEAIGQMIEDDKLTSDSIASADHDKCDEQTANLDPELSFGG